MNMIEMHPETAAAVLMGLRGTPESLALLDRMRKAAPAAAREVITRAMSQPEEPRTVVWHPGVRPERLTLRTPLEIELLRAVHPLMLYGAGTGTVVASIRGERLEPHPDLPAQLTVDVALDLLANAAD